MRSSCQRPRSRAADPAFARITDAIIAGRRGWWFCGLAARLVRMRYMTACLI